MKNRGMFITFEGIDGCGKSTQLENLKKYLEEKNYEVISTLEPGGSKLGQQLRQILLHYDGFVSDVAELFLYLADRSQHVEEIVQKNVEKGTIVLCDRHIDSTVAYQGYGRKQDIEKIEFLNNIATKNKKPDLTFLFDVDVEIGQKRVGKEKDRLEKESLDFHKRVKEGYLKIAQNEPDRVKVINANMTIEEVFKEVKKIIDEKL